MKCVPTIHPAALMRDPTLTGVVINDLVRAREESENPQPLPPCSCLTQIGSFGDGPIAIDIETAGSRLLCIGFCQTDPVVYVVDADTILGNMDYYQRLFEEHLLIFHNGLFDVSFLEKLGFTIPHWVDTMLLHHTTYSELPHSLAFVASVYTRMPYWKWMAHADEEEVEDK
jgi:hypothetical protein